MFNRTDRSMISIWWWTTDRWLLGSVIMLMIAGVFMVAAASPSVAMKIGVADWFFVKRHLIYLALSIPIMLVASLCNDGMIRVMGILGLLVMLGLIGRLYYWGRRSKARAVGCLSLDFKCNLRNLLNLASLLLVRGC